MLILKQKGELVVNKRKILIIVNFIMGVCFLVLLFSILFYKYIPSILKGSYFLYQLHTYFGIIFFILAFFHIYLNWAWIKKNLFKY
ncbi:MAG: DUF4405 domain-containing protein [Candidatus Mcinerneyibacterium aminivorans]|uniref:DUF4405 domain-containing protein n=1 Tax=Candidatus Mcinerneyibacterium aminivorans TaxID=2703815 RepID=A0A5D0MJU6_9BACT|nr:MAG: DUF4405 domain-containing protein [Candidatus Mcinerneyibacterium aminivorans]